MKSKKNEPLSWALLFLTTGLCFLIFSGFLKLISDVRATLFFIAGFVLSVIAVIKLVVQKNTVAKKETRNYLQKRNSKQVG